ncbi:MAG TPA: SMI1/KNR4 family protein [Candidatus Limnocylindrales bacterium]|nr:SMI1/KNR4 family protein [Candidatus Limnocylindrales bacterium]
MFQMVDANPVPIDWEAVEAWLGLRLPGDYKEFATRHGPLDIGEYVWMHVPCVQEGHFEYSSWLRTTHRLTRIVSRDAPPHEPPPFHPMPGGLLAWGTTRATSELFWDTSASGDPDEWPVVVFDRDAVYQRVKPFRNFGISFLGTLTALLGTGLDLPSGKRLGPLPPTARRTAFLSGAMPWTPPVVVPHPVPEPVRRHALTHGSGLETLALLAPPPERPYLGEGTWPRLFDELGTTLPADYMSFMEAYGVGLWSDWLGLYTPLRFEKNGLVFNAKQMLDGYRELRAQFPEYFPLAVWPEPGGFLPFASSVDGDDLGWLTVGQPDDWPLAVHPRHADQGPPLPGGLLETMLDWLRGRPVPNFPKLDPLDDPLEFISFKPRDNESNL